MTKVRITCEFEFDFDRKAPEDFIRLSVQGVVENIYSRQLSHQLTIMGNNMAAYKKVEHHIKLDTDIAKKISDNTKVEIIN